MNNDMTKWTSQLIVAIGAAFRYSVVLDVVRVYVRVVQRIGEGDRGRGAAVEQQHPDQYGAYQSLGSHTTATFHIDCLPSSAYDEHHRQEVGTM